MADKGFTIKDILKDLGIDLNTPSILEEGNYPQLKLKQEEKSLQAEYTWNKLLAE